MHPDDIGKRVYSDETGKTYILDDPLPVRLLADRAAIGSSATLAATHGGKVIFTPLWLFGKHTGLRGRPSHQQQSADLLVRMAGFASMEWIGSA